VPVGDLEQWTNAPFAAEITNGEMIGRGAVDMKGAIACFIAAAEEFLSAQDKLTGSISLLITGDEEGPSINGTDKLLKWVAERGDNIDACIVGEPSNTSEIGDTIKNGRRGSLSGRLKIHGVQGHSAYPHLADNPVRGLIDLLDALLATPFDTGTNQFQPTNLEVTSVDVGNPAANVIPATASAIFNIRFNDLWDGQKIVDEILLRFERGANSAKTRKEKSSPVNYSVDWIGRISPVFLTTDQHLTETLSRAIKIVSGKTPQLSTGGGTSDARFIKDFCPVVEFGLVGKTMHQIDERVSLDDLQTLTNIYRSFLGAYLNDQADPAEKKQ